MGFCEEKSELQNHWFWLFQKHDGTGSFYERTSQESMIRKVSFWKFSIFWENEGFYTDADFFFFFLPPPSPLGKWVYTPVDNWQVSVADSNNLDTDMCQDIPKVACTLSKLA
jgi:hypothetical protein